MGVTGIGGVFFRAKNPDAMNAWYRDNLHVVAGCNADANGPVDEWSWTAMDDPTVYAPFKDDTDYFAPYRQYMLNFRVVGIDALLASLKEAGIEVINKPEWNDPQIGKFARIHDPEGNPIRQWEAPA